MPVELRKAFEKADADRAHRDRGYDVEVSKKAQLRRRRRAGLPPRLRFARSSEGAILTIGAARGVTRFWIFTALAMGLIVVWDAVYNPRFADSITFWLLLAGIFAFSVWSTYVHYSERILLVPERRFLWQQRNSFGVFKTVLSGEDPVVEFTYDTSDATLVLEWGRRKVAGLGDADVEPVQHACQVAGIRVLPPPVDKRDEVDNMGPSRWERYNREFLIVGIGGLVVTLGGLGAIGYFAHRTSVHSESTAADALRPEPPAAVPEPPPAPNQLEGSFTSGSRKLGSWTLAPERCVSGRELGFTGIAFLFPAGSPVTELRVEAGASSDNYAEWRFADPTIEPYRVLRRECRMMGGKINTTEVRGPNSRAMQRMKGNFELHCPKKKLDGAATFDGCLPPS